MLDIVLGGVLKSACLCKFFQVSEVVIDSSDIHPASLFLWSNNILMLLNYFSIFNILMHCYKYQKVDTKIQKQNCAVEIPWRTNFSGWTTPNLAVAGSTARGCAKSETQKLQRIIADICLFRQMPCTQEAWSMVVDCPTRWSLSLLIGFLWWSCLFPCRPRYYKEI